MKNGCDVQQSYKVQECDANKAKLKNKSLAQNINLYKFQ